MTRRENMLRAARRQEHQWITLDFGMSPKALAAFHAMTGPEVNHCEYFNFDGQWLGAKASNQAVPDWKKLYFPEGSIPDNAVIDPEWGYAEAYLEETDDASIFPPLRNISTEREVDEYPWPDVGMAYRYEGLAGKVNEFQEAGYPVFVSGSDFFESIWHLRGFDTLMLDMAEGSAVAKHLFMRMSEIQIRRAEQAARTGADILQTGSDVATQRGLLMSPAMWREYIFPMMRDCIAAAKRIKPDILVLYHSCGNVTDLIDGLIEAGVDILDPCQPEAMDIFELKRRYGKVLSFHGGIGVQSVLPFGDTQEVRDMVRKTIDIMAEGGGYLCGASHTIRHEIPMENLLAFVETVREYGEPPEN